MARRPQDRVWWSTLVTLGRVAASLSVAACHATARYSGRDSDAAALVLAEPALSRLADEARSMAAALAGAGPGGPESEDGPRAGKQRPQASPSQQARAAAERAAAERRATQQAFMERAIATRAARSASAATGSGGSGGSGAPAADDPVDVKSVDVHLVDVEVVDVEVVDVDVDVELAVPTPADVRPGLGEREEEEIPLGVWDTLMRPR